MATSADELTECIVCFETFRDPQLLTCQHTFCKRCVGHIADAGAIQCPTCKKVSLMDDVRPDFRLAKFLDALARHTEELTGQKSRDNKTQKDPRKKLCDLCEDKVATHWCKQCEQWICDHCKRIHLKQTISKSHDIMSIKAKNQQRKVVIEDILEQVTDTVNAYQSSIDRYQEGEAKISAYQETLSAQCKQMRAQCHQEVDRQFDGLEERVKAMISPNAEQWQQTHAESQRKLQELERQKQDLEQALADIESGLVCSDVTVEETKAALKTMKAPDFSMQLQRVQLEISTDWMKTDAVTVKAEARDVIQSKQVSYVFKPQ